MKLNREHAEHSKRPHISSRIFTNQKPIKLGYMKLNDAAPLIAAAEFGIFKNYDLNVSLERQIGWATLRDKIAFGDLHAAHALAPMPFAATLGLQNQTPTECIVGMIMSLNGNAITLGSHLQDEGLNKSSDLLHIARERPHSRKLTFGIVSLYSSHNFLLRKWLKSIKLSPDEDVRIVVIPPNQMVSNLATGNLDGFCAGEPWNAAAIQKQIGIIAATSHTLENNHPEKVIMARHDFAKTHSKLFIRLLAAIIDGCSYCENSENHEELIKTLSSGKYLDCDENLLRYGFADQKDREHRELDTCRFGTSAMPSTKHGKWIIKAMDDCGLYNPDPQKTQLLIDGVFLSEYYKSALKLSKMRKKA